MTNPLGKQYFTPANDKLSQSYSFSLFSNSQNEMKYIGQIQAVSAGEALKSIIRNLYNIGVADDEFEVNETGNNVFELLIEESGYILRRE